MPGPDVLSSAAAREPVAERRALREQQRRAADAARELCGPLRAQCDGPVRSLAYGNDRGEEDRPAAVEVVR